MRTGIRNHQRLAWQLSNISPHPRHTLLSSTTCETKTSLKLKDELLVLTLVLADSLVSGGILGKWDLDLLKN